jgi:hypothetical protein
MEACAVREMVQGMLSSTPFRTSRKLLTATSGTVYSGVFVIEDHRHPSTCSRVMKLGVIA